MCVCTALELKEKHHLTQVSADNGISLNCFHQDS